MLVHQDHDERLAGRVIERDGPQLSIRTRAVNAHGAGTDESIEVASGVIEGRRLGLTQMDQGIVVRLQFAKFVVGPDADVPELERRVEAARKAQCTVPVLGVARCLGHP